MKRWRTWQWVVVPVVVFGLTEALARWLPRGTWYDAPIAALAGEGDTSDGWDILLVGNSRVQLIDAELLAAELRERGVPVDHAYQLARGNSYPREHQIGVERIIEARGGADRLMVINETSGGVVDDTTAWAHPSAPYYLTQTMRPRDLGPYWLSPADPLDDKIGNTVDYVAGKVSTALNRRHGVRVILSSRAWSYLAARLSGEHGGAAYLLTDDAAEQAERRTRNPARLVMALNQLKTKPYTPLTVEHPLNRWIALVQARGGQLVFYPAQITTTEATFKRDVPARAREAAAHRARMDEAGVWFLEPDFEYTDDDLPDAIHMTAERRPELTRAVAAALAARLGAE